MPTQPDPALLAVIDAILADAPESFVEWRRTKLEDDEWQWYRDEYPELIADKFDPVALRSEIIHYEKLLDPFSDVCIRRRQFLDACDAGGEMVMTSLETGEEVMRRELPGSPEGGAPNN